MTILVPILYLLKEVYMCSNPSLVKIVKDFSISIALEQAHDGENFFLGCFFYEYEINFSPLRLGYL